MALVAVGEGREALALVHRSERGAVAGEEARRPPRHGLAREDEARQALARGTRGGDAGGDAAEQREAEAGHERAERSVDRERRRGLARARVVVVAAGVVVEVRVGPAREVGPQVRRVVVAVLAASLRAAAAGARRVVAARAVVVAPQDLVAVRVVVGALVGVAQALVGALDLAELLDVGVGGLAALLRLVGVQRHGELLVGLADRRIVGGPRHAEHVVVAAHRHACTRVTSADEAPSSSHSPRTSSRWCRD
jgi:hypothetical protein